MDWSDIDSWFWYVVFSIILIVGSIFIFKQYDSKKTISGYYLTNEGNTLAIGVQMDYSLDPVIPMNGHTIQEITQAIDSLNKTLVKK